MVAFDMTYTTVPCGDAFVMVSVALQFTDRHCCIHIGRSLPATNCTLPVPKVPGGCDPLWAAVSMANVDAIPSENGAAPAPPTPAASCVRLCIVRLMPCGGVAVAAGGNRS